MMGVEELRAKAGWTEEMAEQPQSRYTFQVVLLSDAVAVVERAERRVRDLEAALERAHHEMSTVAGLLRLKGDDLGERLAASLPPLRAALAGSPEGGDEK